MRQLEEKCFITSFITTQKKVIFVPVCVCLSAEPKLKDLRSSSIEDGKKMILKCELVSGNPEPNFKWYKNGKQLAGKNKPKSIKIKRNKQKP